jgi:signal transduction histidine kinase
MIKSISHKITLIIVSVSAFAIITGGIVFSYVMIKNMKDNYIQQGLMDLDLIAEYLVLPLGFKNKERANEILSKVTTKPYIHYCVLLDAENNLFVAYKKHEEISFSTEQDIIGSEGFLFEKDILMIYKPIIYENRYYGWIIIYLDTQLSEIIKQHIIITLIIIVSVLILSLLLTLGIQNSISKPIITLAREMNNLSVQEDFTQNLKEVRGGQEIKLLYNAFNRLINKIAEREIRIDSIVKKLRQNENKFRTLTENSPDLVIRFNTDLSIDYANTASLQFLNKKEQDVTGIPVDDIDSIEPDIKKIFAQHIKEVIHTKEVTHCQIKVSKTPPLFYDFTFVPELSGKKSVVLILCIGRNITTIKDAELHLIQSKIKAEESDRLKSAFLANMSHEIRTPMNAIIGFSQLIKDKNFNEKEREDFIDIIQDRGKDLMMIINDIIDLSKIEAGEFNLIYEVFSLKSFMNSIILFYKKKIRHDQRNYPLEISCDIDNDVPKKIFGPPSAIKQILFNLLSNALKFTEKGFIHAGIKRDNKNENMLLFYVEDSGIGIPKEKQDAIFNRFVQIEEYSTRKYGGTGLGLSICQGLISRMGGNIGVKSEEGKGSVFYFYLPFDPKQTN